VISAQLWYKDGCVRTVWRKKVVLCHEFEEMNEGASQMFALVAKVFQSQHNTQHPTPNTM